MDTGLRKTEALKLKKSDVQTDVVSKTQYVIVQESKNNENVVFLCANEQGEIVSRLIEHKEEDDCIFQLNTWTVQ